MMNFSSFWRDIDANRAKVVKKIQFWRGLRYSEFIRYLILYPAQDALTYQFYEQY